MTKNMIKKTPKAGESDVIQISITMERHLKNRYAALALSKDLSLSQLIRLALKKFETEP
jgi:hypothetical protein